MALGSATVSPINMANGYATIANGGRAVKPYIIESVTDEDGEPLYTHQVTDKVAMSEDIAADVSYALQQVVESGSGTAALALDRPAAGKTGTSTNTAATSCRPGSPATPRRWRPPSSTCAATGWASSTAGCRSTSAAPTRRTPGWRRCSA